MLALRVIAVFYFGLFCWGVAAAQTNSGGTGSRSFDEVIGSNSWLVVKAKNNYPNDEVVGFARATTRVNEERLAYQVTFVGRTAPNSGGDTKHPIKVTVNGTTGNVFQSTFIGKQKIDLELTTQLDEEVRDTVKESFSMNQKRFDLQKGRTFLAQVVDGKLNVKQYDLYGDGVANELSRYTRDLMNWRGKQGTEPVQLNGTK